MRLSYINYAELLTTTQIYVDLVNSLQGVLIHVELWIYCHFEIAANSNFTVFLDWCDDRCCPLAVGQTLHDPFCFQLVQPSLNSWFSANETGLAFQNRGFGSSFSWIRALMFNNRPSSSEDTAACLSSTSRKPDYVSRCIRGQCKRMECNHSRPNSVGPVPFITYN